MTARHPTRTFAWGVGGLIVLGIALLAIFGARPPQHRFRLALLVRSDVQIAARSPVRIAGVTVGRVESVRSTGRDRSLTRVDLELDKRALPIHADATAKIRPRLLLEGNFFVELSPGTPAAPRLDSGASLPAANSSGPVQFDRVLSDLPLPTRLGLRSLLQSYGGALGSAPGGGQTGGEALNESLRDAPQALKGTTIVTRASLGRRPHDLSRTVGGFGRAFEGLARDDRQLAELVDNFSRTVRALSDRNSELGQTVVELSRTAAIGPSALRRLRSALPPLGALARRLAPSFDQLRPTIAVATPWLRQVSGLAGEAELGGASRDLEPLSRTTAAAGGSLHELLARLDAADICFERRILPVSTQVLADPPLTSGVPVYLEGLQALAGLGAAAAGYDGNGAFVRGQTGGGTVPVKTSSLPTQGPLFGNAVATPLGTRPAYPAAAPPVRPGAPCSESSAPELTARSGGGP